jgi:hypothetical protein
MSVFEETEGGGPSTSSGAGVALIRDDGVRR